ncbi:hypothetical protein QBC45DRAFT_399770 [Copromyces sp. CBS 386.78]|nr:hypothetical protein QBC45DRAFT_399770 [Copromyces sp. CBS 386.78]
MHEGMNKENGKIQLWAHMLRQRNDRRCKCLTLGKKERTKEDKMEGKRKERKTPSLGKSSTTAGFIPYILLLLLLMVLKSAVFKFFSCFCYISYSYVFQDFSSFVLLAAESSIAFPFLVPPHHRPS